VSLRESPCPPSVSRHLVAPLGRRVRVPPASFIMVSDAVNFAFAACEVVQG